MSSKAYQEASKKETDKCRIAITNLYMAGINHDGHSWNTFGDIEDCLAVVIEEMYMQGARDFANRLLNNEVIDKSVVRRIAEQMKKGAENELG